MKVLKEFFRLKWEEICEFFRKFNEIHIIILIWLYFISCGYICIYTNSHPMSPYFFTIYLSPLWLVFAIIIIGIPSPV